MNDIIELIINKIHCAFFFYAKVFITLFSLHSKDGRVIVPLLKTIEQLLSQSCLNPLLSNESNFASDISSKLKIEIYQCTDVQRIFGIVGVLVGLLSARDENLVRFIDTLFDST